MGLLSNPTLARRNKFALKLAKHSRKISSLLYLAGLVWFCMLTLEQFNHGTYISENALSPGLVYPEIRQDSSQFAQTLLEELERERIDNRNSAPHAWISSKMKQIGLETYVHNFTLSFPFNRNFKYEGKNIYGILRAPRIGSTEGIVFSTPYRAPTSEHTQLTASVPVLLAFADFARRKNYWAKDLIFLVTEQEQLGMRAWLDAYHEGNNPEDFLQCGVLPARAGALQAALNLEIQDFDVDYIDVKIESLNGQLPNLDLFNIVQRITAREGLAAGYKHTPSKGRRYHASEADQNLKNMLKMLLSQASGVPTGNHGLCQRNRIEALTMEAVKPTRNNGRHGGANTLLALLKTLEGISRSLNNLLERFHQSFFFYILVHNNRFVSIGDYMPCLGLMAASMFLKAFLLWLSIDLKPTDEEEEVDAKNTTMLNENSDDEQLPEYLPYGAVIIYIGCAIFLGIACNVAPLHEYLHELFEATNNVGTSERFIIMMSIAAVLSTVLPFVFPLPEGALQLLHIAALITTGVVLLVLGLLNFALGFFLGIVIVPLAILVSVEQPISGVRKSLTRYYALLLNPLVAVYLLVLALTVFEFPELVWQEMFKRAFKATGDAIVYAVMDSILYKNFLFIVVTAVLLPLWTLYWTLALALKTTIITN